MLRDNFCLTGSTEDRAKAEDNVASYNQSGLTLNYIDFNRVSIESIQRSIQTTAVDIVKIYQDANVDKKFVHNVDWTSPTFKHADD